MEEIVLGSNSLFVWADKSYSAGGSVEAFWIPDDIKTNKNTIIIENGRIDYGTAGRDLTSKTSNQTTSMILFGCPNYGNTVTPISAYNMKVYRLKLYENDVLVREYVPCYRVSDNKIGLYELVNNVFYPNNGTGTFNKGNDIVTSGTMTNQHFVYNVAQNLQNNSFSRAGYIFNGWNTEIDGTGTSYDEGQSVSELTTQDNAIVNLYSQWILIEDIIDDDVHLADGSWNEDEGINTPKLVDGLIPVTYNNDGSVTELTSEDYSDWYDYSNKEYANAITKDQNDNITGYWVWIPRYEYIVNSATQSFTVKFIPVEQIVEDSGYEHIHPAFRDGSQTHYMNGEWDQELPGFWVAKFPAGYQKNTITDSNGTLSTTISNSNDTLVLSNKNYTNSIFGDSVNVPIGTIDDTTKMSLPVFNPLTYAYNMLSIGDSYTLAQQVSKSSNFYGLNENTYSHMLKNSEFGAVTYLALSQYGRNGTEPNINNYYTTFMEEPYREAVTGVYADVSEEWMSDTLGSAWYTAIGQLGSSTGNMTGVYDLNGCVGERAAGYMSNGSYSLELCEGELNWINTTANVNAYLTESSKYYTVYTYDQNSDTPADNWAKYNSLRTSTYGYGDAILETSTGGGSGLNSWYSAISEYTENDYPFLERGGNLAAGVNSGIVTFEQGPGYPNSTVGFRVALCP